MNYFVADDLTGRILKTGSCAQIDLALQAGSGQTAIEGTASEDQYILSGELITRPENPISQDEFMVSVGEQVTFSGIPIPSTFRCENIVTPINDVLDPDFVWSSLTPGKFVFRVDAFPYQDKLFFVEVTE